MNIPPDKARRDDRYPPAAFTAYRSLFLFCRHIDSQIGTHMLVLICFCHFRFYQFSHKSQLMKQKEKQTLRDLKNLLNRRLI